MAGKVTQRRDAPGEKLVQCAEQIIAEKGLHALCAHDLTAGSAVKDIHTVFDDVSEIVQAVNARTFDKLGGDLAAALAAAPQDPVEQLIVMGHAYHRFAADNHLTWRALFDAERLCDPAAPDWYREQTERLLTHISDPLVMIFPERDALELALLTRAIFSSVHGIVLLGLDQTGAGVPFADIDQMIDLVLRQIAVQS